MSRIKACVSPVTFCVFVVLFLAVLLSGVSGTSVVTATSAAASPGGVFTNPAAISPVDRPNNNAGSNPGLPPSNYPSAIVVTALTGTVTKVTVTLAVTSTFPDDIDILLVGPTGAHSLLMSDAGGSGNITARTFTFDQAAATAFPDTGTDAVPVPAGTYRPANYVGLTTTEPGGQDNFPMGGGLMSYPTTLDVFNGTNPNGTWNLYVVDDQVLDLNSVPNGWSIDITTGPAVSADAPVDFNGDGRSDYAVVRNVGGGSNGQIRWFYNTSSGGPTVALDWGLSLDFFVIEDFDGDLKDDVTVYRPADQRFYILQSATNTVRIDPFGLSGDDPTVVGDYDGDGKADVAVVRYGGSPGAQHTWFYRGSLTPGVINFVPWGISGDFVAPGDYDGDGKHDFVVQRNNGGGQARFWRRYATGTTDSVVFGTPTDLIAPGDYDGDGKCDIATFRSVAGQLQWQFLSSFDSTITYYTFGLSASDFVAQGDYDGDGKIDPTVWRPNADPTQNFFFSRSSATGSIVWFELGQNGDYPIGNYNTH